MVYARDRDAPPWAELFFLEDGSVTDAIREYTRRHLVCVVPGCPSRGLVAHARSGKRDGFVHVGTNISVGHSEGVFHQQGKAALLRWVRVCYPGLDARAEVTLADGRDLRRPDVLVTFPAGQRVGFEVQYASLTVAEWTQRHRAYERLGIRDVWLFGHTGKQMPLVGGGVRPNEVHRAVLAAGLPLLWLNPLLDKIATCAVRRTPIEAPTWRGYPVVFEDGCDGREFLTRPDRGTTADLIIEPLHSARLTADGVHLTALDLLDEDAARLEAINAGRQATIEQVQARMRADENASREAAEVARRRREEQETRWRAEKAARRAAAPVQVHDAPHADLALANTDNTDQRTVALQRIHDHAASAIARARDEVTSAFGTVPGWLGVTSNGLDWELSLLWQWEAYRTVIRPRVGRDITVVDGYRVAENIIGPGMFTGAAVRAWLWTLRDHGLLEPAQDGHFTVSAQLTTRVPVAYQSVRKGARTVCAACRQPLHIADIHLGRDRHAACWAVEAAAKRTSVGVKLCKGCAYPLTPDAEALYHPGCEPWRARAARYRQPPR